MHKFVERVRDFPNVKVLCTVSASKVYWIFFFAERTVRGVAYLDMLQQWLMQQLQEDKADFILQDVAPAHFLENVRDYLDAELPDRWIGRTSEDDNPLLLRPPRSSDLTSCNFFSWGYIKDRVYVPPLLHNSTQ